MNPSSRSLRSPRDVAQDPEYVVMRDFAGGSYYPAAEEIVVRHVATNTFWRAVYVMRADDSDYDLPASWKEVRPEVVTRTAYVPV